MIKSLDPQIPAVTADGTTPMTPKEFIEHLRVMRAHVPNFGPLPKISANALRTAARVPPEFALSSINTVGASPQIAAAISNDSAGLLGEREDVDRWSAVEDEIRTLLEGVSAANLARRHRVGLAVLQVYSIARQLVRKKEHADLLPHVENMRRTNPFGRRRAPQPEAKPAADPVVPPVKP